MEKITTGVIIKVISEFILRILGLSRTKTIYVHQNTKTNRKWKILIIIGRVLFWFGGFYGLSWALAEGFDNPKTVIGLTYCVVGLLPLMIGKIGLYLNK